MAVTLEIDAAHPQPRHIKRAVEAMQRGHIVAYPTDTSYGLGCDLLNKGAIERVYQLKRLEKHHQLSFICADLSDISQYALLSDYAFRNMKRLLPGPYTFILPATKIVPRFMLTDKRRTVGIRIPAHPIPIALVRELGHPIISTTAGFEGEEPLASAAQIAAEMGKQVELILDTGIVQFDESSVVDLTGDAPEILRRGKGDVSIFEVG